MLDLDGGAVGGALRGAASHSPFHVVSLANTTTYARLVHDVERGDYHAALVAQPGATAALAAALAAVAPTVPPYDPAAALTLVFDEGRGGSTMAAMLRASSAQVVAAASAAVERTVLQRSLVPAVSATTLLLHPVPHAGMTLSAGIAYILCWITMLTITMICLKARPQRRGAGPVAVPRLAFSLRAASSPCLASPGVSACGNSTLACEALTHARAAALRGVGEGGRAARPRDLRSHRA